MTDEMLLAVSDWREMTDTELKRAVTLAKRRGRQTAELLYAWSREYPGLKPPEKIANFDMYIRHCVAIVPDSKDLVNDWGNKNALETCEDPRLAWFCVIFQRTRWKLIGNTVTPRPSLMLLQKIRDKQFRNLSKAQICYSMQAALIQERDQNVCEPRNQAHLKRLQDQFMLHLDYAMLAVMSLQVETEEWIEGAVR